MALSVTGSPPFPFHSLPQRRAFPMPFPGSPALRQLDRLNRSSPDFHDQLCDIVYGADYQQCMPNLQDNELVWLVDYLDRVRRRVALPYSPLMPA
jgi:hypothetical protein